MGWRALRCVTTFVSTGTYVFNGGTGRFTHATGSAAFVGTPSETDASSFDVSANGTLDY